MILMELTVNEHISLKTLTSQDSAIFYQAIADNKAHLRKWIPWVDQMNNEQDAIRFLKQGEGQMRIQKCILKGIFYDHELIGCIEMQNWNHELKKANVGYWLVQGAQGKGIMLAVGKRFLAYLFQHLHLNKIELWHMPENLRSATLAKRLGFKIEGVLRDSFLHHGKFCDLVVQGLLKSEFKIEI